MWPAWLHPHFENSHRSSHLAFSCPGCFRLNPTPRRARRLGQGPAVLLTSLLSDHANLAIFNTTPRFLSPTKFLYLTFILIQLSTISHNLTGSYLIRVNSCIGCEYLERDSSNYLGLEPQTTRGPPPVFAGLRWRLDISKWNTIYKSFCF